MNNTFGERHTYVLDRPQYGQEVMAHKVFHVSPFCPVEGGYRFEFKRTGEHGLGAVSVRVDYDDPQRKRTPKKSYFWYKQFIAEHQDL